MSGVDVTIPCFNYARFLPQCVASVLDQRGVDVRVLIIDDCSTDESETVGRSLAQQDARVAFRRHLANRGHIATYNEGLEWSSAEYSLLLSADDALVPGALARATKLMNSHGDVGMTYGRALIIGDDCTQAPALEPLSDDYRIVSGSEFLRFCCATGNPVPTPTAVVRRALQDRLGGYRASLPHTADMEMWMRFAVHAPVGILRAVQGYYRRHTGNMNLGYFSQTLSDSREVIAACEEALAGRENEFPESRQWLASMYAHQAERALWLASSALDQGDLDGFYTCLRFAEKKDPRLCRSGLWWRVRAKRLLGQPWWHRLRAVGTVVRAVLDEAERQPQGPPALMGRWPD